MAALWDSSERHQLTLSLRTINRVEFIAWAVKTPLSIVNSEKELGVIIFSTLSIYNALILETLNKAIVKPH